MQRFRLVKKTLILLVKFIRKCVNLKKNLKKGPFLLTSHQNIRTL